MSKKYTGITVIGIFLLLQGCSTFTPKEDASLTMDGLNIMTTVSKRDRGEDYIISASWQLAKKGRIRHSMRYREKRKNYGDEEAHQLLSSKEYEGNTCFLVESVPTKKKLKYGKRISWIDQQRFIPLKIEYYDKKGNLWKTLHIEWQNKDGLWFWKKAEVTNIKVDYKTFISIEEVRVNPGLPERDFTKVSLKTKELGF